MSVKPNVCISTSIEDDLLAQIGAVCETQVVEKGAPRRDLLAALSDVEGILLTPPIRVDAEFFDAAPKLRVVSTASVGYDPIDVVEATRRGVLVCHTPGVLNAAVADLTMTMIFLLARKLFEFEGYVRSGGWARRETPPSLGMDIQGKTLGVVGFGRIGQEVTRRMQALGMRTLWYDVFDEAPAGAPTSERMSLNDLLAESDFVSLHTNLGPSSHHLIGAAELAQMKSSAFFINTARGPLVDQPALTAALTGRNDCRRRSGRVGERTAGRGRPNRTLAQCALFPPYRHSYGRDPSRHARACGLQLVGRCRRQATAGACQPRGAGREGSMIRSQAAIVYAHNQPVVVEEVEIAPPKAGEVLLRMAASGVCHSDLSVVNGTIYYDPPVVLGHEGAAIVEEIGPEVSYVQPGDHVLLAFATSCGECALCKMGHVVLCSGIDARPGYLLDDTCRVHNKNGTPIPQMARIGTMSEYAVVSERSTIKIDKHYPLDKAVLVGCGVTTGVGAVTNTAGVKPGDTVAVIGTGGVGLNAVQGAAIAGAKQIIAVDLEDRKLELASSFGATDAVNPRDGDPVEAVRHLTGGLGVDYAIEVIGNTKTIEQAYQMVRRRGTVVVVGMDRNENFIQTPAQDIVRSEKRLVGSYYGSCNPREEMPKLLKLYDDGTLKLDELITRTYRLDQINQAFDDLVAGDNARGVIVFA